MSAGGVPRSHLGLPRSWLAVALCGLGLLPLASWAVSGSYCDVAKPPVEAGYNVFLGVQVRVYPAPGAIASDFSGCQSVWLDEKEGGDLQARLVFREGIPVQMLEGDGPIAFPLKCVAAPQAVGAERYRCPPLEVRLPMASLPERCLEQNTAGPPDSRGLYSIKPGCD